MITLDSSQLVQWVSQFFWPLVRIMALFATAPILSERSVSKRVKIGLAVMITWLLMPLLPAVNVTLFSPAGFWLLIQQMLIGIALGFTMQFAFAAVRLAGEVIGLQMGISFATFFDPNSGNTPVISRLLHLLAMLLFLSVNGHLWLLALLAESFTRLPLNAEPLHAGGLRYLVMQSGLVVSQGLMLGLPIITLLLCINMTLGLLNRLAPQLSIFVVGFP